MTTVPADAAAPLRSLTVRSSVWTMSSFGAQQVIRLASNLILTRLLFPEAFGLMALVAVVMQGVQMFSDVGIGPAIIQHPRGDERDFLRTAWTLQIIRGFTLWLIAAGLSPLVAWIYGEPALTSLLPVCAGSALVAGFNSTRIFTANRRLAMGRLAAIDVGSMFVGILVTIAWAWALQSVWALVVGGLVSTALKMVASHVCLPGQRDAFAWHAPSVRAQLRFGRWIVLGSTTTFLAAQMDRLLFGGFLTISEFGVYSIAASLALLPMGIIGAAGKVVLPSFSKVLNEGRDLRSVFHRVRVPILLLGGVVIAPLVVAGEDVVRLMYDARYEGAGWIVAYLALAVWLQMLECVIGQALIALGKPVFPAIGNTIKLVAAAAFIPVGFAADGLRGALVAIIIASVLKYAFGACVLWRHGIACFFMDMAVTSAMGAAFLVADFLGGYDVESAAGAVRLAGEFILASGVFCAVALAMCMMLDGNIRAECRRVLRWGPLHNSAVTKTEAF